VIKSDLRLCTGETRDLRSQMYSPLIGWQSGILNSFGTRLLLLLMVSRCWALAAPGQSQPAGGSVALTYTKELKDSVPEYLAITVHPDGTGTYEGRKLDEPSSVRSLKLTPATTQKLFALASDLGNFASIDLESHKRVANLGLKTFTFEAADQKNRCEFNYTLNRQAQELTDVFEGIATAERHLVSLEYGMKYDHLSLPKELLQIQIDLENRAMADPQLLVEALEQIVHNPRYLHVAQARAQDILQRVQDR
jgi:hypothetical protein